jgi:hypothetical protein
MFHPRCLLKCHCLPYQQCDPSEVTQCRHTRQIHAAAKRHAIQQLLLGSSGARSVQTLTNASLPLRRTSPKVGCSRLWRYFVRPITEELSRPRKLGNPQLSEGSERTLVTNVRRNAQLEYRDALQFDAMVFRLGCCALGTEVPLLPHDLPE